MNYRREIDGLRALAVLPVILCHAGFQTFSGGFVGVDVFFVISGYLITNIILGELAEGNFSIVQFYERRARRILPALFLVMGVCTGFAYAWMMPDEFKNFGQSVLATTVFSNNILLAITSGYWELASEFKPLLHTWSLGVEEQYYVIYPFFMMLGWRYFRRYLVIAISAILLLSLLIANWGLTKNSTMTFYLLPTRAWELLIGALVAFYLVHRGSASVTQSQKQVFSLLGFTLILFAIFVFDRNYPSPGLFTLIPTCGAALIIVYARDGAFVHRVLSSSPMVVVGLISYSFYLWHQPLFAFSRVYFVNPPTLIASGTLVALSAVLAYLTWKFVETPFRNKAKFSLRFIFVSSIGLSVFFIAFGFFVNKSYGMPSRIFDSTIKLEDMDKKLYNGRAFAYRKDRFSHPEKLNILVIGNSFGRDFVNMTVETFDTTNAEIVYRDDLTACIFPFKSGVDQALYGSADVIVFATGLDKHCLNDDLQFSKEHQQAIFYVGTKHFGYNLNWLIRIDRSQLPNQFNPLLKSTLQDDLDISSVIPPEYFISLLEPVVRDGQIPITDHLGRMLSTDRAHLTKYGAIYFGHKALLPSRFGELLTQK